MLTSPFSKTSNNGSGLEFELFSAAVQEHHHNFNQFFTTDAEGLFDIFLHSLPEDERQHHNCRCCRHFINRYGGLVAIEEYGRATIPVLWGEFGEGVPKVYRAALQGLRSHVSKANITGVFLSSENTLGTPQTGIWTHFNVNNPKPFKHPVLTASQAMAEKREDYIMLNTALAEFTPKVIETALEILRGDALYRAEKVIGVAEWLDELHKLLKGRSKRAQDNLIWRAVTEAPAGFCHVRSSMIGTLLEDIQKGCYPLADIQRRFADKMHPLKYQRPQAAPTSGNIAQAEKIFEKMGLAAALKRRFARLEEVDVLWSPQTLKHPNPTTGIFGHLNHYNLQNPTLKLPTTTMTWVKFRDTVLPSAVSIEMDVPYSGNYGALVTAEDPTAPPLLQWDREDRRNPVSSYVYHGGSANYQFGLNTGYCKVTAICLSPSHWYGNEAPNQSLSVMFILNGAKDKRYTVGTGLALFPETLRSELHSVRSTIEAYSRSAQLSGADEASACGLFLGSTRVWNVTVRVINQAGTEATYKLDRWD